MTSVSTISKAYRGLVIVWGFVFLISTSIFLFIPGKDPYRCRSLLTTGRWVDPADKNGDRVPFKQWQPDNCMLHDYRADDIVECIGNRSIVVAGDSTSRSTAEAIVRLLNLTGDQYRGFRVPKHEDWQVPYRNLTLKFIWNPFLQTEGHWNPYSTSGDPSNLTVYAEEAAWYKEEFENPVPYDEQKSATLFLFGAGPWFAEHFQADQADMWRGRYHEAINNASRLYPNKTQHLFDAPMHPTEGMGNQLFFVPPSRGCVTGYDEKKWEVHDLEQRQIRGYQQWLREMEPDFNFHMAWSMPQVLEGQNKTFEDNRGSGWHYIEGVSEMRANMMFNYRCNAKLARKNWPIKATCCTDYGHLPFIQLLLVWAGMCLLGVGLAYEIENRLTHKSTHAPQLLNMQNGGALVLPLLMSYYADRTQMMGKGEKVLETQSILILCGVVVLIGILFSRRIPAQLTAKSDQSFLSKSQITEWKGLTQLLFICISWANHQSTRGSIVAAVLGSSILFQSAYEHTTHFLTTRDYSFTRVAFVLLRLNLFASLLCHFTGSDYLNYSYIALASFFFLVVWATMSIGHEQLNNSAGHLFSKIVISMAILIFFVKFTPALRVVLFFFKICNIHWDVELLEGYLSRDLYISHAGMLLAVANFQLNKPLDQIWTYSLGGLSFMVLGFYWSTWSEEGLNLSDYMQSHSMTSFIPILCYICLRNISATVRSFQSRAFEWAGNCSIELYGLHFHLFLAQTGHGVLLLGAFAGDGSLVNDRWRDIIFIVPVFILAASLALLGTSNALQLIFPTSSHQLESPLTVQSTLIHSKDTDESSDEESLHEKGVLSPGLKGSMDRNDTMSVCQIYPTKIVVTTGTARGISLVLVLWALNIFTPNTHIASIAKV